MSEKPAATTPTTVAIQTSTTHSRAKNARRPRAAARASRQLAAVDVQKRVLMVGSMSQHAKLGRLAIVLTLVGSALTAPWPSLIPIAVVAGVVLFLNARFRRFLRDGRFTARTQGTSTGRYSLRVTRSTLTDSASAETRVLTKGDWAASRSLANRRGGSGSQPVPRELPPQARKRSSPP